MPIHGKRETKPRRRAVSKLFSKDVATQIPRPPNETDAQPTYAQAIHEQLIATFTVASERALLATVEAIAARVGVVTINGMPVHEFYHRKKETETEQLIADFADVNPTAASHVKTLWDIFHDEAQADSAIQSS